jgi:hypothetical protein
MNRNHLSNALYLFKILGCAVIIVILALCFDSNKDTNFFLWASLTAFLTIQMDSGKKINFNQLIGNFIGSAVGILIWLAMDHSAFIHSYSVNLEYFFLVTGIFMTSLVCILFREGAYTGIALSSFLIVTIYDVGHRTIDGALLRIVYCFIGCIIAYLIEKLSVFLFKTNYK